MTAEELRELIVISLQDQGFLVLDGHIYPPSELTKEKLRDLHSLAVQHRVEKSRKGLKGYEQKLIKRLAAGNDVVPEQISPRLIEVQSDSGDELLFRYASLHWSIPVSSGYGRRIRFLVIDEQNEKLIGLFGLGDPVFGLADRDHWIGWDKEARRQRLNHVLDAFVLGAVPPYSYLLCGKLVAMLVASNEVREAFKRKYGERQSIISGRSLNGLLALITTTSALGRSSIYNRITFDKRILYNSVGFTRGSGEFHFSNGVYSSIMKYVAQNCKPSAKHEQWGIGYRNRREVIRKCLSALGLSMDWIYHGVQREIYVIPLAKNTKEFLRGEQLEPEWFNQPATELFARFRERWLLPRAARYQDYQNFLPSDYQLWNKEGVDGNGQ